MVCMYVCMYVGRSVGRSVCRCVCVCVYVFMYVCTYVCTMCVGMCVCVDGWMDWRLIDCGDLKTKVRVSFVPQATLWGPQTKH